MSTAPNVTVIPAKVQTAESRDKYHQLRVAAYCRVSTELEEQQNSYQVQIAYYTDLINKKKEWTLAGIFADEGISGTQTKKRTEFNRMIRMCRNKKIDLVITKSISRFARNTVDCLEYVRQLKDLGIGVIFEKENINTLTMTSEFMIALYGSFAQAESESISKNVSWGKEKAYREGKVQFQYKHLLGYKKGADGKPEIIPEEAETVKTDLHHVSGRSFDEKYRIDIARQRHTYQNRQHGMADQYNNEDFTERKVCRRRAPSKNVYLRLYHSQSCEKSRRTSDVSCDQPSRSDN